MSQPSQFQEAPGSPESTRARIPSLDGIRAVSIVIVLVAHMDHLKGLSPFFREFAAEGQTGVNVFFVISGYLITRLLVIETHRHGSIDVRAFYLRRARRILPALLAYLAVLALLVLLGIVAVPWSEVISSALYYRNFAMHPGHSSLTGHIWSLAVEEHFYLVWPVVLAVCGTSDRLRAALWTMGAALLFRLFILFLMADPLYPLAFWTPCRTDTIMAGCILALFTVGKGSESGKPLLGGNVVAASAFAILIVSRLLGHLNLMEVHAHFLGSHVLNLLPLYRGVLSPSVDAATIAVCVHWCLVRPKSMMGVFLNRPVVEWCGRISYSLYLWHALFFASPGENILHADPWLAFACSIGMAAASHYFIERPFLRIPVSSGHETPGPGLRWA